MSFVEINLNDAVEPQTVGEGQYTVRVTDRAVANPDKSFIRVMLSIENSGREFPAPISHPIFCPKEDDDKVKFNNKLRSIKTFCKAFGITFETGTMEELANLIEPGMEATALLTEEDDEKYGPQNKVRRFILA